ncbi:MAG TPA: DUF72 domain-containing protein, partial [Fimbriimonadaceae bacterium]|nr:DUF72 domain-containing protein [Fimbriimonadaceae bacterium]
MHTSSRAASTMALMARLHVGLSGYSYKEWQGEGRFFPPGLKQSEFLGFYAERYRAVEMDGTWYRMPGEDAVRQWLEATPDGFQFSFKMHRRVTHMARLKPESLDSVIFLLERLKPVARAGKLGPFLIQLPPNFRRDDERLDTFLKALPADAEGTPLQWAVEFRHSSWHEREVEEILRSQGVAWVAADTDESDAQRRDTASFSYVRLRKTEYDADALDEWSQYLSRLQKDAFVYCKHEDDESPWEWADALLQLQQRG